MANVYITSDIDSDVCIVDSNDQCLVLNINIPIIGCGTKYVRVWRAGSSIFERDGKNTQRVKLISEL